MITQTRSKRTASGSRYKAFRKTKYYEIGRKPLLTKVGTLRTRTDKTKGNTTKQRVLQADIANIYDSKTKKYVKAAVTTVVESPANRNYVRRNIITKGTIIETNLGKARVTNRPGQEGAINAVLVK